MNAAALTIIAAVGALIAYFQWRTAHQRIIIDLFEKRNAVVNDLKEAIRECVRTAKISQRAYFQFFSATESAKFLFGKKVNKYLEGIRNDLAFLLSFESVPGQEQEKTERLTRIANFSVGFDKLILPYMRLDQKMPGMWLPWRF